MAIFCVVAWSGTALWAAFGVGVGRLLGSPARVRLFNLAIRDLRGNFRGFWVFLACLALGVAAIASVGTIADAVRGGLDAQGRVLLGGDVAVSRMHVRASAEERTWLAEQGSVSEIASLRAMARKPGGSGLASALVEIKAVDAAYPLTGTLTTATGEDAKTLLAQGSGAIIDPLLAERLGLGLGDTLIELFRRHPGR